MKSAAARVSEVNSYPQVLGKAVIVRALYEGRDISATWDALMKRVSENLQDAGAFFDLANILYTVRQPEKAALSQKAAIEISRTFHIRNGAGTGPTVLVFVVAGDFMANTPIEFLLEKSDANILLHFVDGNTVDLSEVPEHDVAFIGIGESAENAEVLERLQHLLRGWRGPILNNAPQRIAALSRDAVAETFKDEPSILAPFTTRVPRDRLLSSNADLQRIGGISSWPIIIRPVGTHAGGGLEKISSHAELESYLQGHGESEFYVAPFVDYSGPDGKFRKQRIAFIDGKAYASHLAVSDHWMVHYLSAGMAEHGDRRAEEASWMADFDRDFAARHARAFDALHRRLGLDYFAIDCAELPDGRLLLFEADVAMIVHAMDSENVFPYKKLAMARLFAGFEWALRKRINRAGPIPTQRCAHTGKPAIYQRNDNDCLICVIAMFAGRTYEEVQAIARSCDPAFPLGGPMSHSIMRGVANKCGIVLLSSIYMLWAKPGIIGVISPTIPDAGHAVLWDGEKIIDPGNCERVDRGYVDRCGLEFTQRARDLEPLIAHDDRISYVARAAMVGESN
ncbi:MAG TPA: hypothetical protein VHC71_11340 [Hyphomicrobium sp.]|nr:hypothetical protein [Hyphomicrobium sp.]